MGAAAGAAAVVLFAVGALLSGDRPAFDSTGAELAAGLAEQRTRIQVGCAFLAAAVPLLIWFLTTVKDEASAAGARAQRTATLALACGAVFMAVFLTDVTALAVSALRPLAAAPETALALRDFELLAMGAAAPTAVALLAALAALSLRDAAVWPRWIGWLAACAAALYALRIGTLFTTDGAFAADGPLGLYVPVAALTGWILLASAWLALDLRGPSRSRPRP